MAAGHALHFLQLRRSYFFKFDVLHFEAFLFKRRVPYDTLTRCTGAEMVYFLQRKIFYK